ncbi:MAG: SAM-dependent methyltransferase [Bacteroides sp.]|nr:SAM-dependent methyltransferase [Bacteroides sp.]MCM1085156.1 SAM-dependent methyltransferase [Bacteroides sp.]MCM1169101.1 SAM-dependent methyltransferase [Bacteroides sp.]
MATLFLLPSCLGDTPVSAVLPADYLSRIEHLRAFFVEDLRSARRFLRKAGFNAPFGEVTFVELNEHTKESSIELLLQKQSLDPASFSRQDIGVISEAGLPCVADPGAMAVEWAHRKGLKVVPLSGPSSLFMALMASGFNGQNFCFSGYLPVEAKDRQARLVELESRSRKTGQTQIFIETPYRSRQMLESILSACRPETRLCVACNITLPDELIVTRSVEQWRSKPADINKKNTVFLISA